MNQVRIFVKSLEMKGEKGPVIVQYQAKDGAAGTAKAWPDANLKEGEKYDVTLETKDGKYGEETWIKVPKAGGRSGGFGGGGKADPAKLAIEQDRLTLEKEKQARFDEKWSKDREAEAQRQASIAAQVVLKAAVDLAIASGNADANAVQGFALDLTSTLGQTHDDIYKAIASRAARGGGQ